MLDLARHVLSFDKDINSLKLQYIMFLSIGKYLDEGGDLNLNLIDLKIKDKFELWDSGPASREVVEAFSDKLTPVYKDSLSSLDKNIIYFLEKDEFLLAESFQKTNVWEENYNKISSREDRVYLNKFEILDSYLEMKIMYFS